MTAQKTQELLAASTLGKVEGHCSLNVRRSFGGNDKPQRGSEGTDDVYKRVHIFDRLEKLRAGGAPVNRLTEIDVYVGDLVMLEKGQGVLSRGVGNGGGERLGLDTDPDGDGTNARLIDLFNLFGVYRLIDLFEPNEVCRLTSLFEPNDVYSRKEDLEISLSKILRYDGYLLTDLVSLHSFDNISAQDVPDVGEGMVKHPTQLLRTTVGLRS